MEETEVTVDEVIPIHKPFIPPGVCDKTEESAPRQLVTLSNGRQLVCDTETDGGGWVVIQRRESAEVDFYRGWEDYKNGFGDLSGNFWYGLENIYKMCHLTQCELRIDFRHNNKQYYAEYTDFYLDDEIRKYKLHFSVYSGTAGDSLREHNGHSFTTKDADNDTWAKNCAVGYTGGWWYTSCHAVNFNGIWGAGGNKGPRWGAISGADAVSFTEIKVRVNTSNKWGK